MQTSIRDAVVAYVKPPFVVAYPLVPIVFDNDPFDWANPPADFVATEIEFIWGSQVGLAQAPKRRVRGFVYFTAYTRLGTGTRKVLQSLDWLSSLLQFQYLGIATFQAAEPAGNGTNQGFYTSGVKVPFFSDPA